MGTAWQVLLAAYYRSSRHCKYRLHYDWSGGEEAQDKISHINQEEEIDAGLDALDQTRNSELEITFRRPFTFFPHTDLISYCCPYTE